MYLIKKKPEIVIIKVEVTGTEYKRGEGYWIRPDKIEYSETHPEEDVWIVLHFAEPEQFVFIKPEKGKTYKRETQNIRGAGELYCIFSDEDSEVKSFEEFTDYLKSKFPE